MVHHTNVTIIALYHQIYDNVEHDKNTEVDNIIRKSQL